jgi:hypothetical protein
MTDMTDLDDLLAVARARPPEVSEALMARVMADALDLQPDPAPLAPAQDSRGPAVGAGRAAGGVFGDLFGGVFGGLFGTGGVLAGLGTAMLAGLVVGFAQPAPLMVLTDALLPGAAIESLELIPNLSGSLLSEE